MRSGEDLGRAGRARKGRGALVEEVLPQILSSPGLHLIPYRAMLDVPAELVRYLSRLLAAERRRRATPARSRRLSRTTEINRAALVLTQFEHKYIG